MKAPKPKRRVKEDAAVKERNAKKAELQMELADALSAILLNEKIPLDISNAETGEVIVAAKRKITKTLLRKIAAAHENLEIDPSPIRNQIKQIIEQFQARFAELETADQQEMAIAVESEYRP